MGKIIAYCRLECPHSENTASLLKMHNKLNSKIIYVKNTNESKQNIKKDLMIQNINGINNNTTFPIIVYQTSKNDHLYIGGNSDFKKCLDFVSNLPKVNLSNLIKIVANNDVYCNYSTNNRRLISYLISVLKID
jgi:glutaredoxin